MVMGIIHFFARVHLTSVHAIINRHVYVGLRPPRIVAILLALFRRKSGIKQILIKSKIELNAVRARYLTGQNKLLYNSNILDNKQ